MENLKGLVKLTTKNKVKEWEDLLPHEYMTTGIHGKEGNSGLVYKCPGCGDPVFITSMPDSKPRWDIDYKVLTAKPSIIHDKEKGGCGWHGWLINGELKPC